MIKDGADCHRPWEATAIIIDHPSQSPQIRGCIIADWSAASAEPQLYPSLRSKSRGILQSELICGVMLLHRLLYNDYWLLDKSQSDGSIKVCCYSPRDLDSTAD